MPTLRPLWKKITTKITMKPQRAQITIEIFYHLSSILHHPTSKKYPDGLAYNQKCIKYILSKISLLFNQFLSFEISVFGFSIQEINPGRKRTHVYF